MKIELNKVYYYNNNEVIPIKKETEDFYLCITNPTLILNTQDLILCSGCELGTIHAECTCDRDSELIDFLQDEIDSELNLIWVQKKHLKEKPIEFKANEKILNEIESNKVKLQNTINLDINLRGKIKENESLILEKQKEIDSLNSKIDSLIEKINDLETDKEHAANTLNETVKIKNTPIQITLDELIELKKDSLILNDLINGGVDNWDYYSESIQDDDFYIKEVFNQLKEENEN